MRLASLRGRAVVVTDDGGHAVDIARAADGRFGPGVQQVYEDWAAFVEWAAAGGLGPEDTGDPFRPADLGAPSPTPRQVFAVGLNYRDHAEESGLAHPDLPPVFTKFVSSFAGPEGTLVLPTDRVDWEAELVVVIGRTARHVRAADAWSHVAGLTVGQDYSERALQLAGPAPQFSLGKSYPGFAPQGPWLVTTDALPDPDDLEVRCTVNGETVQSGRTKDMIFGVPELVAFLSSVTTLMPGDVVFTGTPAGVGAARSPQRFLRPGDVVETTIAGLGGLRQTCVAK
ncbi:MULTISPECIES: fumarylacetoacetate hydrolase family protein [unclassified Streptomyces]|uniref:fumarylacetoacetate hydrolase family protein n=1 Tax=unclassified Streptomyces TaxID=2593676 RepID=UPI0004BFA346|nr:MULTISPECIES: fumarylacetoacetate hydrolase family protein [unclassified Streptomyces]